MWIVLISDWTRCISATPGVPGTILSSYLPLQGNPPQLSGFILSVLLTSLVFCSGSLFVYLPLLPSSLLTLQEPCQPSMCPLSLYDNLETLSKQEAGYHCGHISLDSAAPLSDGLCLERHSLKFEAEE